MLYGIPVHPASFPSTVLFPGMALPCFYRSGSLRSRFPCLRYYDHTTTTHRLSRSLPLRILPVLKVRSCFVSFRIITPRIIFPPEPGKSPVYLYPALSAGGFVPPETLSPHTFPYGLPYICPALRPRLRWLHSLTVPPRSLPLS
jgi:hypothetical protein